jgi:adenine-specific DNA-methyltransferase
MRYIGSKQRLLPLIETIIKERTTSEDKSFADVFCGTASVATMAKQIGKEVTANDNLQFCYAIAKAALEINTPPEFERLFASDELYGSSKEVSFSSNYECVLNYLNGIPGRPGFIFQEYSPGGTLEKTFERQYFTDANAQKIDAIRTKIESWKVKELIDEHETCLLISNLIRATNRIANIAGTYGAFLKGWDKRAFNKLALEPTAIGPSRYKHKVFCIDAHDLVRKYSHDILYLDPPYTWRHYGAYYHILETIARWDDPAISGSTGLRNWRDTKSRYCDRSDALNALEELVSVANCKHLFLSYNSEGIIKHDEILATLQTRGKPECVEIDYRRYRSNSGGTKEKTVKERIYYVKTSE